MKKIFKWIYTIVYVDGKEKTFTDVEEAYEEFYKPEASTFRYVPVNGEKKEDE